MLAAVFSHVEHWVFDLDNTLYPPEAALFDQIEVKMTEWVMREVGVDRESADALRTKYWAQYGTTLAGLMKEHNADPGPYLHEVHDIALDHLEPAPDLAANIAALPGQRIVYTNGSAPYARRVLAARGLEGVFHEVYGVEHADFHPKPDPAAFSKVFAKAKIDPRAATMFEDEPRNLRAPFQMGMQTVHVAPKPTEGDHIHYYTDDLTGFLSQVV